MRTGMERLSTPMIDTTVGRLTTKDAKIKSVLQIWVDRFREAQGKVRAQEEEIAVLEERVRYLERLAEMALRDVSDDRLVEIDAEVRSAEVRSREIPLAEVGGCGDGCGCKK